MTARDLAEVADALEACDTARDSRRDSVRAEVPLELHAKSIALLRRLAREHQTREADTVWPALRRLPSV